MFVNAAVAFITYTQADCRGPESAPALEHVLSSGFAALTCPTADQMEKMTHKH